MLISVYESELSSVLNTSVVYKYQDSYNLKLSNGNYFVNGVLVDCDYQDKEDFMHVVSLIK